MHLKANNLTLGYDSTHIIQGLNLEIDPSEITVIIGSNGSGKSTLLAGLAGQIPAATGSVLLDDKPLTQWSRRELAKKITLLPQQPQAPENILVRQMVAHGRYCHRKLFSPMTQQDQDQIDWALEQTQITALADQAVSSLSGGQRQRAWIAMALAQSPQLMLLDEPTSFLDIGFQFQTLELLKQLNREKGLGIVMVLHDINQASFYADRIIAIESGKIIDDGHPIHVIKPINIERLYDIEMRTLISEKTSRPFCIPSYL